MTKKQFLAELDAPMIQHVSIVTPISQLQSYSNLFVPVAVECNCHQCQKHPEGERKTVTVLQMFVSVDGFELAKAKCVNASVVLIGDPVGTIIKKPQTTFAPGLKTNLDELKNEPAKTVH